MSSLTDSKPFGTLIVIFAKARNLPNRRTLGKQNPYCIARIGADAKRSKADQRGGQTPIWDDEVRFKLIEGTQTSTLKLSILDETESKPELIGDTVIQLAPVYESLPTEGYDMWHELTYKGKYAGEVYLEMTFYPEKKPAGRKSKRSSIMESSVNRSGTCASARSSTTSYYDYTGSLNFSSSMVSMASSRPLPSQPLPATASANLQSSTAHTLTSSLATVRAPPTVSTRQPHSFSVFGGVPKVDTALDPFNLQGTSSVHEGGSHHSNSFDMSAMSHSLPNPLDFQIACEIDLPAIPPETTLDPDHNNPVQEESHLEYQFDNTYNSSQYTANPDDEFNKFFNTPIPNVPENHIRPGLPEPFMNKPLPQPKHQEASQPHSSTSLNNSLNLSTGSKKSIESVNNLSANHTNDELSSSVVSRNLSIAPRPDSQSSSCSQEHINPCSSISNKMSIRRKPISTNLTSTKETPILPYPGAKHSVSDIDFDGNSFNDNENVKEIPFSPDSYVLRKSLPQPPTHLHSRQGEAPPSPPKDKTFKPLPSLSEHMPLLNLTESLTLEPQLRPMKPLPPSPVKEHEEKFSESFQDSYSDYDNGFSQYQHDDSYDSPIELQADGNSFMSQNMNNQEDNFGDSVIPSNNVFGQIGALGKRYYKPQPPTPIQEPQYGSTYSVMGMSLSSMSGSVLRTSPLPRVRGGRDSPSNFTESFSGQFNKVTGNKGY